MFESWIRPSTILLAAVVAANVALPVVHYTAGAPGEAGNAGAAKVAASPAGRPVSAEPAPAPAPRIQPVDVPPIAKRVAHRPEPPVCRAWGPFTEGERAEAVAAALELDPGDFEVFASDVQASPDYLVTVQVPGPRRAADRVMSELRSLEVDSYRLDRPGNVLAAGVFSNPARAETQRRTIAELGYEVAVEPLERSHRVYHLLARVAADRVPEVPPAGACRDIAPMGQFL